MFIHIQIISSWIYLCVPLIPKMIFRSIPISDNIPIPGDVPNFSTDASKSSDCWSYISQIPNWPLFNDYYPPFKMDKNPSFTIWGLTPKQGYPQIPQLSSICRWGFSLKTIQRAWRSDGFSPPAGCSLEVVRWALSPAIAGPGKNHQTPQREASGVSQKKRFLSRKTWHVRSKNEGDWNYQDIGTLIILDMWPLKAEIWKVNNFDFAKCGFWILPSKGCIWSIVGI